MAKTIVAWDDCALMVVHPPKAVLDFLTIRVKNMERPLDDKKKPDFSQPMKVKYKKEKIYTTLVDKPGMLVIQTMQGFTQDVEEILKDIRHPYEIHDSRKVFYQPQFDKMKGFRFKQRDLLIEALGKNRSGLVVAPTRYGKSYLMTNWMRAFPNLRTLVVLPGADLVKQMYQHVQEHIPDREVVQIGAGSRKKYQSESGITVCSVDSLHKIVPNEVELILADEPHALVTESRLDKFEPFCEVRKIGFGATPEGRFDGRDPLITGLFGPVLARRTYKEAVEEGAICPLVVIMLEIEIDPGLRAFDRNAAYNKVMFHNSRFGNFLKQMSEEIIPQDHQTLVFISNSKQADIYMQKMDKDTAVAMAKRLTPKERDKLFERMQSGEISRCLATNIYAQGVTFSNLRCMINLEGGGNNSMTIQKPGRLCEKIEGKPWGIIVDMKFKYPDSLTEEESRKCPTWDLVRDSGSREKVYREKGYKVVTVRTMEELKYEYQAHC